MSDPMPSKAENLASLFQRHVGHDRQAFVDLTQPDLQPITVSYDDFDLRCGQLAAGLIERGLEPGARVAILAENSVDFAVCYAGIARAGMVTVPLNTKLPADTLGWIAEDASVSLVLTDETNASRASEPAIIMGSAAWTDLFSNAPVGPVAVTPTDVVVQMYTSGSTGRPKGVLLTHGGQIFSIGQYITGVMPMDPDERLMVAAPMYHKNAQMQLKMALSLGGTVVLLPGFDAESYLRAAANHGATSLSGVPTMFWLMLARPDLFDDLDLSSVERVGIGSAPMTEAFHTELSARFPDAVVTNGYGTTEVVAVFGGHPDGLPRPSITVGYPLADVETRLVDPATGIDAVADEEGRSNGELWVRSAGTMLGYHNLPDVTAARLTDGWYHTGDVMERDNDGWHWFVGRVDDMFVCAGENVFPGEVEQMLERDERILQAAVVPVPDRLKGALPTVFVVATPGVDLSEDDVKRWALDHGPAYQHPRAVWFVDELPLAGTNKVDKNTLVSEAESRFAERG